MIAAQFVISGCFYTCTKEELTVNMSEDVTAVSMQVTEKAAETAFSAIKSVINSIGRLFRELLGIEHDRARAKAQIKAANAGGQTGAAVTATDLTGIKPGEVTLKDLSENARKNGDSLSVSQHGITNEDRKAIARAAKKYGIPVAFSGEKGKNNLYANVRSSDLPIFRQICTECVRDKIAEQPEALGSFKVQPWELPYLTAALNAHDLPASFAEMKNGDLLCLHDRKYEDAVRIVREDFVQKCREIESDFSFERDGEGFCTLKDRHSGREISFDEISDRSEISRQIQTQFGYDPVKADLAASKFGEEALTGRQKERYFSSSAQNDFSRIDSNVQLEGESVYAKPFSCWHLQPKQDEIPRIVYRGQDGRFAVLEPQKMSRRQMQTALAEQLGITDGNTIRALTDKADRVADHYAREAHKQTKVDRAFQVQDWDSAEEKPSLSRTDADGTTYTKVKPLDAVTNRVKRNGLDAFTVDTEFYATERNDKGEEFQRKQTEKLEFALSDKKKTLHILSSMYQDAGMLPEHAQQMARDVFRSAQSQSPETVLTIEQLKKDLLTVSDGQKTAEISAEGGKSASEQIAAQFDVPPETADAVAEKAGEMREEAAQKTETRSENGHEQHPEGNVLNHPSGDAKAPEIKADTPAPEPAKPKPHGARR